MVPSICGFLAAILVKQASYFLMYSSHSGTPTESPAGAVLAVVLFAGAVVDVLFAGAVVVVFDLFAGAVLLVVLAAPPQPAITITVAKASAAIRYTVVLNFMLFSFLIVFVFGL